jgi:hypothetical protein
VTAPPGDRREGLERFDLEYVSRGYFVGDNEMRPHGYGDWVKYEGHVAALSRARAEAAAEMRKRAAEAADIKREEWSSRASWLDRGGQKDAGGHDYHQRAIGAHRIAAAIRALPDAVIEEKPR